MSTYVFYNYDCCVYNFTSCKTHKRGHTRPHFFIIYTIYSNISWFGTNRFSINRNVVKRNLNKRSTVAMYSLNLADDIIDVQGLHFNIFFSFAVYFSAQFAISLIWSGRLWAPRATCLFQVVCSTTYIDYLTEWMCDLTRNRRKYRAK